MNFSPSAGHEMADRHYALVLSPLTYNRKSGMAIVCAITSTIRGGPFEVRVPSGLLPEKKGVGPVNGVIISDAVRQVDYREREVTYVSAAPPQVVQQVLDRLLAVLEGE
jgi:mRNA interferase MazF